MQHTIWSYLPELGVYTNAVISKAANFHLHANREGKEEGRRGEGRGGGEMGGGGRDRGEREGGVGGEKGEAEKHFMKDQLLTKWSSFNLLWALMQCESEEPDACQMWLDNPVIQLEEDWETAEHTTESPVSISMNDENKIAAIMYIVQYWNWSTVSC